MNLSCSISSENQYSSKEIHGDEVKVNISSHSEIKLHSQKKVKKINLEKSLKSQLKEIKKEKEKLFSINNILHEIKCDFLKETNCNIVTKIALFSVGLFSLYPLIISAIACVNPFRLQDQGDLFSSNLTLANSATGLYTNTGHSIGYLVEGATIVAGTGTLLLKDSYRRVMGKIIKKIYRPHIKNSSLTCQQSNYLYELRRQELLQYGIVIP